MTYVTLSLPGRPAVTLSLPGRPAVTLSLPAGRAALAAAAMLGAGRVSRVR